MALLQILLFPFAVLFDLVARLRNQLYDLGIRPSVAFDVPVISVGNLAVGGTGKTPMIEYIIRLLTNRRVATLSRGYGRTSTGFRVVGSGDTASSVGDEPLQLYRKYGDRAVVTVGEDRALAIPNILQHADTDVILLDDAFQHRRVKPGLSVLLTDYRRPFYGDYLLPTGRLREARSGARRSDIVVVTKCPSNLSGDEIKNMEKAIRRYAHGPVFFSTVRYGKPVAAFGTADPCENIVLVSGIANPDPLVEYVQHQFKLIKHFRFGDHHRYRDSEVRQMVNTVSAHAPACLMTTEKDLTRLAGSHFEKYWRSCPLFYLPIELEFIKNGRDFDALVLNCLQRSEERE